MANPCDLPLLHRSFVRSLRAENKAPRTIEAYSLAVQQLGAYLAEQDDAPEQTAGIVRAHVEGFFGTLLDQGLAAATLHQRYRSLNRFFGYLVDEGEMAAHPMERMRPREVPEQPVPVLTEDEIRALLATAKSRDFLDVRDAAIIRRH